MAASERANRRGFTWSFRILRTEPQSLSWKVSWLSPFYSTCSNSASWRSFLPTPPHVALTSPPPCHVTGAESDEDACTRGTYSIRARLVPHYVRSLRITRLSSKFAGSEVNECACIELAIIKLKLASIVYFSDSALHEFTAEIFCSVHWSDRLVYVYLSNRSIS